MASWLKALGNRLKDPRTLISGLQVGANKGEGLNKFLLQQGVRTLADYERQRQEEKLARRMRGAQSFANLQQAISPRGQRFEPVYSMPKLSLIGKAATYADQGIGAFHEAKSISEAIKDRNLERALTQAQTKALTQETAEKFGRGLVPPGVTSMEGVGKQPVDVIIENAALGSKKGEPSPWETEYKGPMSFRELSERTGGMPPIVQTGIANQIAQNNSDQLNLEKLKLDTQIKIEDLNRLILERRNAPAKDLFDELSKSATLMADIDPYMSEKDFLASQQMQRLNLLNEDQIRNVLDIFKDVAIKRRDITNDKSRVIVGSLVGTLIKDEAIKERDTYTLALTQIFESLAVSGGFADISMLKMLARLQDPGSVVRTEEYNTLEKGLGLFDRMEIDLANIEWGQRLNPEARLQITELALNAYNGRMRVIDSFIDNKLESLRTIPGNFPELEDFAKNSTVPYRLPLPRNVIPKEMIADVQERFEGIGSINEGYFDGIYQERIYSASALKRFQKTQEAQGGAWPVEFLRGVYNLLMEGELPSLSPGSGVREVEPAGGDSLLIDPTLQQRSGVRQVEPADAAEKYGWGNLNE